MGKLANRKFKYALYISTFLHVVALIVFYFGVPVFHTELPDQQEIFTFEVLPASAISNVKNQQPKKKGRVEKKAKQIKQSKPAATKSQPAKQDNTKAADKSKVTKEAVAVKKAQDAPAKKAPEKVQEKKKTPEKKKVEKPAAKPNVPKKAKQEDNPIDTLLKNLEEASTGDTSKSPFRAVDVNELDDSKFSRGQIYDENSPLSITEKLMIKRQIESHWQPPIGLQELEDMRILLYIKLKEDGSVSELDIKNVICPKSGISTCKIFAESVVRAVKQANPLENLSPQRYDVWKEFELYFDPSQISQ